MRKAFLASFLGVVLLSFSASLLAGAVPTAMYGGNGGHNNGDSINDGWLVTLDENTAAVTPVGHPDSVRRLSGIAFNSHGALYATTLTAGGFPPPPPPLTSHLIQINPDNGSQLAGYRTDHRRPRRSGDLDRRPGLPAVHRRPLRRARACGRPRRRGEPLHDRHGDRCRDPRREDRILLRLDRLHPGWNPLHVGQQVRRPGTSW